MARKTKLTYKRIHINVTPSKTEKLKLLKQQNKISKQSKKRTQIQLKKLKQNILQYETKFNNIDSKIILENLGNKISENQKLIIQEIINSSKRKCPRGNRYTEDWVMLCMLLHI